MYEKYVGGLYAGIGCALVFEEAFFGILANRQLPTTKVVGLCGNTQRKS